jgi:hypothetical protein
LLTQLVPRLIDLNVSRTRGREFAVAATSKGGIFQFEKEESVEMDEWEDVAALLHSLAIDYEQALQSNTD